MDAVNAQAERTGAVLVAEGLETDRHVAAALAMGATFGQGYKYGRPTPHPRLGTTPQSCREPAGRIKPSLNHFTPPVSPFKCLPSTTALRRSTKPLLRQLSLHLEAQAAQLGGKTSMLVTVFQQPKYFTPDTAHRYQALAGQVGYIAAMTAVDPTGPLAGEWVVAILSPHYAAALMARELSEPDRSGDPINEFAVTYDRHTISHVIETLLTLTCPPDNPAHRLNTPPKSATSNPEWLFTPLFHGASITTTGQLMSPDALDL